MFYNFFKAIFFHVLRVTSRPMSKHYIAYTEQGYQVLLKKLFTKFNHASAPNENVELKTEI